MVPLFEFLVPLGFVAIFTGWAMGGETVRLDPGALACRRQLARRHRAELAHSDASAMARRGAGGGADRDRHCARALEGRRSGAVVLLLLLSCAGIRLRPAIARNQLELTAIDVGQGDSLLVSFPDGKLMVVDGGGIPTFGRRTQSNMEIGEDVVSPYLWGRSIRTMDVLALTHAHEDHIGGLRALMENFHVRELWTGAMSDNPLWDALRDQARRTRRAHRADAGGSEFAFGGARDRGAGAAGGLRRHRDCRSNNDSLVMRLAYGRNTFLLTGDMERQVEARLFADGRLGACRCAQGAASRQQNSSTADFLDLLRPEFAIISDGFENSYGHPHPDVLAAAGRAPSAPCFRTDRDGLVSIRSDGRRLVCRYAAGRMHRSPRVYTGPSEAASRFFRGFGFFGRRPARAHSRRSSRLPPLCSARNLYPKFQRRGSPKAQPRPRECLRIPTRSEWPAPPVPHRGWRS